MLMCKDIAEQASEYIDGEMPISQKIRFKLHLILCGPCHRFIKNFKLSIQMMRRLHQEELSQDQLEEVKVKIKARLAEEASKG